jgi:LemA protein
MEILLVVAVLAGLGAILVLVNNGIRTAMTHVDEGWSGITVQLKRRHDLVPVLVDAVRVAVRHDERMLDETLAARAAALQALNGGDKDAVASSEAVLGAALARMMASVEAYPDVKATQAVVLLQRQLEETEDQIAAARRLFNSAVQDYNRRIATFPGSFLAPRIGAREAAYFELAPAEMAAAQVAPRIDDATLDVRDRL